MDFYSMLYAEKLGGDSSKGNENFKLFVNRNITKITVDMLDGLTSIRNYAFKGCTSLESIEIPNSVTSLGSSAFYQCTSLESIEISNSVTSLGTYVFYQCTSLTSVEIPNSVTSLGSSAFSLCSSLESIEIPNSVTSLGNNVFRECTALTSVTVRAITPPTLGTGVFPSTSNNLKIYVPLASVGAYKAATNWSTYASKIQAIPS